MADARPKARFGTRNGAEQAPLQVPKRASFEDAVRRVILATEPGDVLTYGEVAEEAGYPGAARAVGNLLARDGGELPWWRIVGARGRLVTAKVHRQADLLRAEGVQVEHNRIV